MHEILGKENSKFIKYTKNGNDKEGIISFHLEKMSLLDSLNYGQVYNSWIVFGNDFVISKTTGNNRKFFTFREQVFGLRRPKKAVVSLLNL